MNRRKLLGLIGLSIAAVAVKGLVPRKEETWDGRHYMISRYDTNGTHEYDTYVAFTKPRTKRGHESLVSKPSPVRWWCDTGPVIGYSVFAPLTSEEMARRGWEAAR